MVSYALCGIICPTSGWDIHAGGQKHAKNFAAWPLTLRDGMDRPGTAPAKELLGPEHYLQAAGWCTPDELGLYPSVLTLGEMDYSFSLALADLRPPNAPLVATSYLAEYDPSEPETYPSDDGERMAYTRRSLPGMNGALLRSLTAIQELGAEVRHSVDATALDSTLRSQGIDGLFQFIVFPFPRFSLSRAPDPGNSRLLREFFFSALRDGFLAEGGYVQLVMLGTQFEEWDVNGVASEAGLVLLSRAQVPSRFFQSREMSGKPWTPAGGELLTFQVCQL